MKNGMLEPDMHIPANSNKSPSNDIHYHTAPALSPSKLCRQTTDEQSRENYKKINSQNKSFVAEEISGTSRL